MFLSEYDTDKVFQMIRKIILVLSSSRRIREAFYQIESGKFEMCSCHQWRTREVRSE